MLDMKEYISSLSVGDKEKTRYENDISEMLEILSENGHEVPDDTDYMALQMRHSTDSEKVIKSRVTRVRKYFEAVMNSEHRDTSPVIKAKQGRKRSGESLRSEKLSIYLTPEMYCDAQDLAHLDGKTFTEYVLQLIQSDLTVRSEKLRMFRELRES